LFLLHSPDCLNDPRTDRAWTENGLSKHALIGERQGVPLPTATDRGDDPPNVSRIDDSVSVTLRGSNLTPAADDARESRSNGSVPLRIKLAFGAPSFAGAGMAIPILIHLTIFYSDVVLIPLGFIALVKAVARAFDAITDPLMGWLTDHTRSRWGRRRPWMVVGAPLAGLAFLMLFSPPATLSPTSAVWWLAVSYTLYYLFHTIYEVPHGGLGPELTLDYRERIVLFGWRVPFLVGGTLVAAVLPPVLIEMSGGQRAGYTTFAVIFGILLTVLYWNLVANVRERPDFGNRAANPLVPGVRRVMRNRPFRVLLGVYAASSVTGAIPGLMMPYFTKYVLRPENPDLWLAVFLGIYFGTGFVCLPIWMFLARRFGKKFSWLCSFVPGITGSLAIYFFLGEGDLIPAAAILVWTGSAFSAGMFLGPSMQADVIDYDELYTGKRREAQYNGLWSVITKFTVIPSMAVPLAILAAYGYQPNVEQTPVVQNLIRGIFGLAPAAMSSVAFVIALRFPISQDIHERIWEGIRAHARGEHATDPLTGQQLPPPTDRGVDESTGWFLDHFSPKELRRMLSGGVSTLLRGTVLGVLISLAISATAVFVTFHEASDLSKDPGVMAVFSVVIAGFAFSAMCFHIFRVRAALKLRKSPIADDQIRNHLAFTEFLTNRLAEVGPRKP
jgi:GPH family glycoside/pentoside/hexuronide:cation symporter